MAELKVDVAEMRAQMGRANVSQTKLAERAGVHRNTVNKILRSETADLESIAKLTYALNMALKEKGQPEVGPFDLIKPIGFPAPQMGASALYA